MTTIKVKASLSIGFANMSREESMSIEVPDSVDGPRKEDWIDEQVREWANNFIRINWEEL